MFTNKWKYLRKQKRKNAKNAMTFFLLIVFYVALSIYRSDLKPTGKLISPLPESPIKVKAVMAKERAYKIRNWDENLKIIIDEFKDLGKEKTLKAIRIAYCESGLNEKAFNPQNPDGSNDGGIFQINSIHKLPDEVRFDAIKNIKWAKSKVEAEGDFYAWVCANYL